MIVTLVFLLVSFVGSSFGGYTYSLAGDVPATYQAEYAPSYHNYKPKGYKFEYAVSDPHTGDHKSQWETKENGVVRGAYSLLEPDGTTRIVEYIADDDGFRAVVKKIGHSIHDEVSYGQLQPLYNTHAASYGGHYSNYLHGPVYTAPVEAPEVPIQAISSHINFEPIVVADPTPINIPHEYSLPEAKVSYDQPIQFKNIEYQPQIHQEVAYKPVEVAHAQPIQYAQQHQISAPIQYAQQHEISAPIQYTHQAEISAPIQYAHQPEISSQIQYAHQPALQHHSLAQSYQSSQIHHEKPIVVPVQKEVVLPQKYEIPQIPQGYAIPENYAVPEKYAFPEKYTLPETYAIPQQVSLPTHQVAYQYPQQENVKIASYSHQPIHQVSGPVHQVSGPVHQVSGPVHQLSGPVQQVQYAPSPVNFGKSVERVELHGFTGNLEDDSSHTNYDDKPVYVQKGGEYLGQNLVASPYKIAKDYQQPHVPFPYPYSH